MVAPLLKRDEPWCAKSTLWWRTLPMAMEMFKGRDVRLCQVTRPRAANIQSLYSGFYPDKAEAVYERRRTGYAALSKRYHIPELHLDRHYTLEEITDWLRENVLREH